MDKVSKIWVNGNPNGTFSDYEYVGGEIHLESDYPGNYSGVRIGAIGKNAYNEQGFLVIFGDDRGVPAAQRKGTIVILVQGR